MRDSRVDFDVLIAGGGPVGAALAAALRDAGLVAALADPGLPADTQPDGAAAAPFRPIALSHASTLLLERVGALDALSLTPIRAIHVSQTGGFGRTLIEARDVGVPALGWVGDLAPIAEALQHAARSALLAARVTRWESEREDGAVRVRLADGRFVRARLLVLADGGGSAGDGLSLREYGQAAVVAQVRTERPAAGVAWERFTTGGPLALLPFADRYAVVWSMRTARARELLAAPDAAFLAALGECFGRRVGRFTEVGARVSFPLTLRFRRAAAVAPRVVAIGNAAQTLHPVAGQGLNLGLRDAFELAAHLDRAGRPALERGEVAASYAAQRRADRYASIGITDGLVRVFGLDHPLAAAARGLGLAALDLAPPARRFFARRFVFGLRALP
ncbi:MAG: FAD-dependent monooxygenase [Burkholderiales bacterium]|nr:FAD-dependent monooxygenase [Burkholderiales bacterium]